MEIEILGIKYPICYTVLTEKLLDERFHGIENVDSEMEEANTHGKVQSVSFILAALIAGGVQREKEKCAVLHTEYSGPEAITEDQISALMKPGELFDYLPTLKEAMRGAYNSKIKLQGQKGKNAEATRSE